MTSIGQVRRSQPADLFNWKPKKLENQGMCLLKRFCKSRVGIFPKQKQPVKD